MLRILRSGHAHTQLATVVTAFRQLLGPGLSAVCSGFWWRRGVVGRAQYHRLLSVDSLIVVQCLVAT